MNWARLYAIARRLGRVIAVATMSLVALGFASLGMMEIADRDQPIYWGAFTEVQCEPPEFGWGECRSLGTWVSDDGNTVKNRIYLDGDVRPGGSVRASFQPQGWISDAENNVVHAPQWTHAGGAITWAGAAICGTLAAWWAFRWWCPWGQGATWRIMFKDLARDGHKPK